MLPLLKCSNGQPVGLDIHISLRLHSTLLNLPPRSRAAFVHRVQSTHTQRYPLPLKSLFLQTLFPDSQTFHRLRGLWSLCLWHGPFGPACLWLWGANSWTLGTRAIQLPSGSVKDFLYSRALTPAPRDVPLNTAHAFKGLLNGL